MSNFIFVGTVALSSSPKYRQAVSIVHYNNTYHIIGECADMKSLLEKVGKGYSFGLDTNVLIDYPTKIFEILKKDTILISRHVQTELDGLKKSEGLQGYNARNAFKALYEAQTRGQAIHILPAIDKTETTKMGLSDTMDDHIIASYIQASQSGTNGLYFVSTDNGAKITAKNAGLNVLDIQKPSKFSRNSSTTKIRLVFGLVMIIAFCFLAYNLISDRAATVGSSKQIFDRVEESRKEWAGYLDRSTYQKIVEDAVIDPSHVYFPANANDFIQPTLEGNRILASLENLSVKDREQGSQELKEILTPLVNKYYPSFEVESLTNKNVQTLFNFGKQDLRYGMVLLKWSITASDTDLLELLAFDASTAGMNLFKDYENLDQVKISLIDALVEGPFKEKN